MYLVSVYFEEGTNKRIRSYMKQVAEKSGNYVMLDGNVPPHITISAFETRREEEAVRAVEEAAGKLSAGTITWCGVGTFLPHVIYLAPVLNAYLHRISVEVYEGLSDMDEVKIRPFYRPFQWMPHTTIGKMLTEEEMRKAFAVLQGQFGVFSGRVTAIGLARTNPYEDIVRVDLAEGNEKDVDGI